MFACPRAVFTEGRETFRRPVRRCVAAGPVPHAATALVRRRLTG